MKIRSITLFAAPLASVLLYFLLRHFDIEYVIAVTAAITLLTATWWVTAVSYTHLTLPTIYSV